MGHCGFLAPGKEEDVGHSGSPHELLRPRCGDGPTIDFIGHHDARDLRPELPKFRVPGAQVLVGDFPPHIEHLP